MESCSMSSGFIQVAETADLISMVLFMNTRKVMIKKRKRRTPKQGLDVVHFCHDRMFIMSAKFPIAPGLDKYLPKATTIIQELRILQINRCRNHMWMDPGEMYRNRWIHSKYFTLAYLVSNVLFVNEKKNIIYE
ncbi:hypothetical protein RhiirA5_481881 [Rhizophagus irregularis]|uniref:Uncharacterized protein n=1 Tax=Rhizophagus irregularis TaxID=588596 RepID=A0A2N0PIV9_9GLOM|nr:hypothetical protein RhiirA5_481881 [Rhizophagus irregularis]